MSRTDSPFLPISTRAAAPAFARRGLRLAMAGGALALLGACTGGAMDWDLRTNPSSTANDARQATAARPVPDQNGVLSYPGYQLATARRGETVASLSTRLGLGAADVARSNALSVNDPLREGELVLLPARVSAAPQPMATVPSGGVDIGAIATTALDNAPARPVAPNVPGGGQQPDRHVVKRGETAFTIARSYNVSAKALADWNNLGADMAVREGQSLLIPVATGPAPSSTDVTTIPGTGSPTPTPPSAAKPLPDEKTKTPAEAKKDNPASPDVGAGRSAASSTKMTMPASGSIVRAYDKKKNQGIDIGASAGSPVKAADAGTIAAITKDTDQVQIVVIRHANNLLTVYAGVDGLKVKKGDSVSRGQQIGVVRNASPAILHFEVRRGVDSLDPATFLQ